ncbi:hydroxyisourate hydrolase [Paenibacillus agricola]|uniref:5-hydroxyisourate hydrolase n=1 Tax=Paenibacillus agricola TaxID=2716264 RepID=A0ABX0JAM9_9BACL|nr:hydroxyisourate hydrolase [Paenibacillus agricola]NHN31016.1 hydroxyisourate hydrolase [Paenibacillus agricola]
MNGRLTTHVLDLSCGLPAQGVRIELFRITTEEGSVKLAESITNTDGRLDAPLLTGNGMLNGFYELLFHVGDYYRSRSDEWSGPMFLEEVPIRFSIANSQDHYHVPLLVAPGGYSTYRGS